MTVDVRLFAVLSDQSTVPYGDAMAVPLPDSETIEGLIRSLGIDPQDVHLVMVNGRIVHDRSRALADADRVGLFPPVGGG